MGSWTCFTTALSVILALAAVAPTDALDLIRDGKAVADVYYQNDAPQQVQDAATEIARVLSLMGSVKVQAAPVTDEGHVARNKPAILVGQLAEQAGLKMDRRSRANDGFRYKVDANRLMLVGESPRGVFIGANRLLQQLGANWYVPGEVGEVIPKKRTVAVPDDLEHSAVSDSIHRRIWYGGGGSRGKSARATDLWLRRHNGDLLRGSWRHAYSALVPKKAFEEHPEWFSYDANRGERCTRQLCTTNPQVIRLGADSLLKKMAGSEDFVFPAGPNDGGGLCECAKCKELRSVGYNEPSSNEPVASTQVFQFASALADITSKEYPDRDLGILVYSDYSRIPKKMGKVNPNVFPMIAPIRRCRLHGPGNPNCQWNQLWDDEIQGWAELSSKLAFYIYNYNLADTLVPLPKTAYYRRLLDSVDRAGIRELGWTIESIDSWATHAPAFWLASQLTWNSDVNVDQSMDQFYRGFYGNAYKPMKSYWTRIDKAYETANVHTGSQYGLHHIWVPELLQASRQDITQAKKFARGDREKEAVAMADAGLKAAELFMKSWNALGDFVFLKARQYEEQLEQLISKHAE
ncbi:MAG: DUF4838 domain-containing protein, partial [Planctomycetes bacterium]|nr:DUF4838 domain-containing protein [Planctomycetota bacterium]